MLHVFCLPPPAPGLVMLVRLSNGMQVVANVLIGLPPATGLVMVFILYTGPSGTQCRRCSWSSCSAWSVGPAFCSDWSVHSSTCDICSAWFGCSACFISGPDPLLRLVSNGTDLIPIGKQTYLATAPVIVGDCLSVWVSPGSPRSLHIISAWPKSSISCSSSVSVCSAWSSSAWSVSSPICNCCSHC